MADQSWEETSWDKRGQRGAGESREQQVNKALRTGNAVVLTEKKFGAGGNAKTVALGATANARKLEDADDVVQVEKPSMEMRKLLAAERNKAGLTQAQLAQMCNIKPNIIAEYENGKGIPSSVMLGKIERALRAKNPDLPLGTLTKAQKFGTKV